MASAFVFGEVLWDLFGTERQIGGAPFNFAAHFAALGGKAWLCSAVGRDELGTEARDRIRSSGVSDAFTAEVSRPTGACVVTKDGEGQPCYQLLRNTAYDEIPMPSELPEADLLYLGTLARRSAGSAETARRLVSSGKFREIFVDVNIRKPDISREILEESLRWATILKLNREEVGCLAGFGLIPELPSFDSLADALRARCPHLKLILLTLDRDGAILFDPETGARIRSERPANPLVSAVGAGDSFSAAFASALLNGRSAETALEQGVLLSDYVVTQLGAVPELPEALLRQLQA